MDEAGQRRCRDAALPVRLHGHATFDSTYYYIHTSPDFMDAYAQITRNSQSVLPDVGTGRMARPPPAEPASAPGDRLAAGHGTPPGRPSVLSLPVTIRQVRA